MKFSLSFLLAYLISTACIAYAQSPDSTSQDSIALDRAHYLSSRICRSDFKVVIRQMNEPIRKLITAERLQMIWKQLGLQMGHFDSMGTTQLKKIVHDSIRVFETPLFFERGALGLQISLNDSLRIAGIYFAPMLDPRAVWKLPSYAQPESYIETEAEIPSGNIRLKGTLTLPREHKAPPVIILVHGSGPNDRDESIGPNKPFKDLAVGLGSRGIGTLRYDKRTFSHSEELKAQKPNYTAREEVIDDVKAAFNFLKQSYHKEIGPIYLLGHSLGAMLMPRIAAELPQARGFILLAAPARPIEDLIVEQTRYLLGDTLPLDSIQQIQLDETLAQRNRVKELVEGQELQPGEKPPFGAPSSYWKDLAQNPPSKNIAAFGQRPILLLQGGRDYQVTRRDFELWEEMLEGRPRTTIQFLPLHNHLFMSGIEASRPEEYLRPDHVGLDVIDLIVRWINQSN